MVTMAPLKPKLVPIKVIWVPPPVSAEAGVMLVMLGAA